MERHSSNIYLHLRKSRHLGDPDDPALLQTHRAILKRLAREDGAVVPPDHLITEVESGEFLQQRPEFRRALEAWERLPEGAGGVLYCMGLDRLSRGNEIERARVRYALRRAGILIRTPSGWIDLADADQRLLAGVTSELAEHELARNKRRIELARAEMTRRGEILTGAIPYGYRWDRNGARPEPDPVRFPILAACCREVFTTSVARLAARYGAPPTCLLRALRSPVICGWTARRYRMDWSPSGRRRSVLLPRDQWLWAEAPGGWEAACSREQWESIQVLLTERGRKTEWTNRQHGWCRDVLRFPDSPPSAWVRLESSAGVPVYGLVDPATRRRRAFIPRAPVHEAATGVVVPLLSDPARLVALAASYRAAQAARTAQESPSNEEQGAARLAVLRRQLDAAARASLDAEGLETRAAYRRVQSEIEAEIRSLTRARPTPAAAPIDLLPLFEELTPLAADLEAAWPAVPGSLKRRLVNALIAAIPVTISAEPDSRRVCRTVLAPVLTDLARQVVR